MTAIDLRSDLMGPRSSAVAMAMADTALHAPAMSFGEDPHERALNETLIAELEVEAVLLVPTCTMANQIAIRLHLAEGGTLASAIFAHVVTVEARATALTGVTGHSLVPENGHPSPSSVDAFLDELSDDRAALVWLENTHMLSSGSVMPAGWQKEIADRCHKRGVALHLDGSRLWNAAVACRAPMKEMVEGCDTVSISLNKAIGAPVGSILAGSKDMIDQAVRWRDAMGGKWRPISSIAAAALAALDDWRARLETDAAMTQRLAEEITERLGEGSVLPAPTNLIFLNRPAGDAVAFVEALGAHGVQTIIVTPSIVRLAIHNGVRETAVGRIVDALVSTDLQLASS